MDPTLIAAVDVVALLITIVIGAVCGYLAGKLMNGGSLGLLPNIVVGIVGAAIFSFIFGGLHLVDTPLVNEIVGGTIGSMILLFVLGLVRKTAS